LAFALAAILLVTRFIVANSQYSFLVLPPNPISDRWGMAQILTVQAQAQPRGGIHQHIQHFFAI
jgi:hypothetical protein